MGAGPLALFSPGLRRHSLLLISCLPPISAIVATLPGTVTGNLQVHISSVSANHSTEAHQNTMHGSDEQRMYMRTTAVHRLRGWQTVSWSVAPSINGV